ncbi:unnamed protein product [Callosobruchus maculatus]|uniref:Nuclear cap-binding protein subunit 3 n=1 Tax=Callosobruchus maculatus TaxID=64391 RepID=A0A653DMI7_CALMS|nr:unnamed protein product [Callosobruchus maculatus]
MAALLEAERPNIRIEIENNVEDGEKMEVDEVQLLEENEEGEIVEDESVDIRKNLQISIQTQPYTVETLNPKAKTVFTTGINIFDKEEQKKLQERARRFALKPEEIKSFTEADLAELYESLGINSKNEIENKFDTVHMIGITGMSAEDILEYFAKYAPLSIEWIDQNSCNVVWLENITAARAMFYTSKAVNGMPAREAVDTFAKEFLDDVEEPESGESILVKKQKGYELDITDILPHKVNIEGGVDMSQITISIPPGYWRLGEPHPKSKCILMRYSLRTDMKPYKTEDLAWYYKKLGVERKRRENKGIFERNRNLIQDKNPWASLARNWDNDVHCEPEPEKDTPKINIKNPQLLVRLGKKKPPSSEDVSPVEDIDGAEDEDFSEKAIKLPRMRMYADEEEEKQRRKRLLRALKKQSDEILKENQPRVTDLRSMLNMSDIVKRIPPKEIIDLDPPEHVDLNTRVRHNAERMVVTVKRDLNEERNVIQEWNNRETTVRHGREDARKIITSSKSATLSSQTGHRRRRSPIVYDRGSPSSPRNERRDVSRSPIRRDDSMRRYTSSGRRSPQNTSRSSYHQNRSSRMMMYSDRSQRTNSSSYWIRSPRKSAYLSRNGTLHSDRISSQRSQRHDDDRYYRSIEKPRSKVAVVIKKRKVPTVRSIVLPRVRKSSASQESESESSESDSSESSDSSSSSDSESESSDSESESESGSDSESAESDSNNKRRMAKQEHSGNVKAARLYRK